MAEPKPRAASSFQLSWMPEDSPLTPGEHAELVAHLTRKMRDSHLAEDIAQDAVIRLLTFMRREVVRHPKALAYRIAENLLINAYHRQARRACDALGGEVPDDQPSAERVVMDRERLDEVRAAIDKLPRKRREVLIRRRVHGESHEEISAAMGISITAVEKHVVRALASIREELDRRAPGKSQ